MTKSILIVDDHPMISHGLKSIIARNGSYNVIGEASDGRGCLKLVEQENPDVVILDITLKDGDGISLIMKIREIAAETKIIMYTMHSSKEYIGRAFVAGALAYVLKSDKIEDILTAIEAVLQGRIYLSNSVPQEILSELIGKRNSSENSLETLTPREYEIAALIARGNTPRQIAELLCISPKTVRVHRTNLMHKLSCSHVHELLLQLPHYFPE